MLQTKINITPSFQKVTYHNRIMTLGSCFAENIGAKMKEVWFDADINPFGVLYNPISIQNSIRKLINGKIFTENEIFQHKEMWQSFSHSSLFSDITPEKCLDKINSRFTRASDFFRTTDFLFITFGTAWVFEEKETGVVVSNCHKLPSGHFVRRVLGVDEIVATYKHLIRDLHLAFPNLKIIFSVSPVRHWKDGAHGNNLSKSTLLLAIDLLEKEFEYVQYFPAYEIMMDELRDYRFYASDMLHPSEVAIDYIWKQFSNTYFGSETMEIFKQLEQLKADIAHRPLFPESKEYALFQKSVTKKKDFLTQKYPFLEERLKKIKE